MSKSYVITVGQYGDYRILNCFDNQNLAKKYMSTYNKVHSEHCEIKIYDNNPDIDCFEYYRIEINHDGDVSAVMFKNNGYKVSSLINCEYKIPDAKVLFIDAFTDKKELLLGGGVGCNLRLQEMAKIMCKERNAKFFVPENEYLTDNGSMIGWLGYLMYKSGSSINNKDKIDIYPNQRTDEVEITWIN